MKRWYMFTCALVVALFLAVPGGVAAQLVLGVGGGLSAATWTGSDADEPGVDKSTRKGLRVGGFLAVPVSGRFSIVPAAFYVQKGNVYSEGGTDLTAKVDYFEIPVLASVSLTGPDSPVGFSVNAGPAFAFEAGCDIEGSDSGTSASVDCDTAGLDERQSFDIGLLAAATAAFPVGESLSILVSGGANFGLRTLDTSDPDPADIKNMAYFLSAFVAFPLGG